MPLIELELKPAKEALISDALLRHDIVDVRVTVVSCITEIIRLTAPKESYDDDQMKDYFKLVNTAYRKLPSMAGRNYAKAVSIIEAISFCQICVRMLDIELHNTILEMFHLFLDGIQSSHPQEIFSSMEHIMTLMIQNIEESDDFMVDLIKIFLGALKKENKNISPCAFQLAKKVFEKCADNMHNFVPEAVRHMGDAVQEYDDVIALSFLGAAQRDNMNVEEMGTHACGREPGNQAGDLILSSLEGNHCIDNLKDIGSIDENHVTVPYSSDHTNCQENVCLEVKGMGVETSYHEEVNLQNDENVNVNNQKMTHLGDQISWRESDLETINSTSGPDGSTPCINTDNSNEMRNFGSLTEQNLPALHAILKPRGQVSHVKDCDTIRDEDSLEKQHPLDANFPVNIEGAHCEQQNLKRGDLPILGKRSRKPNSMIKPEEGYDRLWTLCELASSEGSHRRKSIRNNAGIQKKNTLSKSSKSSSGSVREPMNAELRPQKKFSPEEKDDDDVNSLSTPLNNLSETVASANIVDEECTEGKLDKSPEIHLLACTTDEKLKNPIKRKRSVVKPRKKIQSKNIVFEAETSKDSMKVKCLKEADIIDGIPKHLKKGLGTSNKADLAGNKKGSGVIDEDLSGDILIKTLVLHPGNRSSPVESHSTKVSNPHHQRKVTLPKEKTFSKKRQCTLAKEAPGETSKGKITISDNQAGNIIVKTLAKTTSSEGDGHCKDISGLKRRSEIPYKEKASKVNHAKKGCGKDLVGCKIKVWWPLDELYYEGKVASYDHLKKTHQVEYDDGETEILDLTKERWEVIINDSLCGHELKIIKAPPSAPSVVSRDCGCISSGSSKRKLKGL